MPLAKPVLLPALLLAAFLHHIPARAFELDPWDEHMQKATQAWERADLPGALGAARAAVQQGRGENADRQVSGLALLARIAQESGDLTLAEQSLRGAIERIDRIPGDIRQEKAILHNNLGALLDQLGDLSGAESQYRAALALQMRGPENNDERFPLLLNLAGLLERRGDDRGAAGFYQQAAPLAKGTTAIAALNNNWATLLHRQGDSTTAQARLQTALTALPESSNRPLLRASILHNLGTMETETGQLDSANGHLTAAEEIRHRRLGDAHLDTARTLASLALLRARQGDATSALSNARSASAILTRSPELQSGWQTSSGSQIRRDWREAIATHLRLLAASPATPERRASEALEIMQLARHGELARVFARALFAADGEAGDRLRAIEKVRETFASTEQTLAARLEREDSDTAGEESLRRQLAEQHRQLEMLQAEFATRHPRYHELLSGQRLPLPAARQMLGADEAAIVFLCAQGETFALAISRENSTFVRLPVSSDELATGVRRLRQSVTPESADTKRYATDEAYALYRTLLEPLSEVLADKAVWFIVPDGPLESIPFSLFLQRPAPQATAADWKQLAWLIRQHAPVTLPSLGSLALARSTALPASAPEPLLAVADPVLGTRSGGRRRVREALPEGLWQESSTRSGRLANPEQIKRLAPLPDTADEARAVAAALGGGELLLGSRASETEFKAHDLGRYRNLLFATHGLMAGEQVGAGEAALVMTPPASANRHDDGLLAASEIAQLRLNADWVVLSACNTAAGDGKPGAEGLSGLAKAFFHAGARNLLVSHWSVVSQSTVLLSTGTFRRLRDRPEQGKARALQAAMLDLIDGDSGYSHPLFWAPFVLVGDGR
ncbi:CHAT domain-containing protein [Quatrionicoccus australiensis]|uniref:CHAT domain-containing protein n=1 Tax=Quatrionicoccus australiensis TaxID=138118 RepID=UPI001CFA6996|nr:CHAT domain-containing tetratricopeptide repeat protein [Quatrionicoccus australiensis]MCB4359616.1 CHAT domain-containing protein [Quatrionicoccus australiensis]